MLLAELRPDHVPGPCAQIGCRSVEGAQYPEAFGSAVHQPLSMLHELIGLLGLKLVDELVQLVVVAHGGHGKSVCALGDRAVTLLTRAHIPHDG